MPISYELTKTPLKAGESRELTWTSSSIATGQIYCFVSNPPPPDYKPCDACGSFNLVQGEKVILHADINVFGMNGGQLIIELADNTGDTEKIVLPVHSRGGSSFEDSSNSGNPIIGGGEQVTYQTNNEMKADK